QNSTESKLEAATVLLGSVGMYGSTATFHTATGTTHKFVTGQDVRVEGVVVGGNKNNNYNATFNQGVWHVTGVSPTNPMVFTATQSGVSGLGQGTGGSAGD